MLELTAGTGSIGSIGSSSFSGFQTLIDDLGGDWTLTGSNTIANVTDNGSLVAAGSLHVTTAVTSASAGQFELQAGASLEVAADSAANSQIDFLGASQLTIDNAALFGTGVGGSSYAGPQLEDFGVGDTVDLHSFSGGYGGVALQSRERSAPGHQWLRARSRPWTFRIRHWGRGASASPQTAAEASRFRTVSRVGGGRRAMLAGQEIRLKNRDWISWRPGGPDDGQWREDIGENPGPALPSEPG